MRDKKYSIRFTEEEDRRYEELRIKVHSPNLSTLIRDLLDSACENPQILNPIKTKTDIDVLMNVLEKSANETIKQREDFQKNVQKRLEILEKASKAIMKKLKVSKRTQKKVIGDDTFEEIIFD